MSSMTLSPAPLYRRQGLEGEIEEGERRPSCRGSDRLMVQVVPAWTLKVCNLVAFSAVFRL